MCHSRASGNPGAGATVYCPPSNLRHAPTLGGVDFRQISAYYFDMRRKPGTLIPIEQSILAAAVELVRCGDEDFHGFRIAKEIRGQKDARLLTGHGTLYRALGRLEQQRYLSSRWEDPLIAAQESRPRRKLYRLTAAGATAGAAASLELSNSSDGCAPMKPIWAS